MLKVETLISSYSCKKMEKQIKYRQQVRNQKYWKIAAHRRRQNRNQRKPKYISPLPGMQKLVIKQKEKRKEDKKKIEFYVERPQNSKNIERVKQACRKAE